MPSCAVCGNDYDKALEVIAGGQREWFDSFECAIHMLAPRCAECGVPVVGHGVEQAGVVYCCAHCSRQRGSGSIRDRA